MRTNMVRKLKFFSILALSTSLFIGCGEGFRAAKHESKNFVTTSGGADDNVADRLAGNLPDVLDYENPTPGGKSVQEQILEEERAKAEAEAAKKAALNAEQKLETDPKIQEKQTLEVKVEKDNGPESDGLVVTVEKQSPLSELSLENVKDALAAINPDLAGYLEGLTLSIRAKGDKKLSVEVLAVIKRGSAKIDRIMAEGEVGTAEKKVSSFATHILKMPSQASLYSSEDLYAPAKNTETGFVCAEESCDSAYLVLRSRGKINKEAKIFKLVLELKRHGQTYQVVRSNASDKPLMTKSFHEAE